MIWKWKEKWKGKSCRLCVLLLVGWLVLSFVGYAQRDGVYRNYMVDVRTTPYFALVFQGIHDGIYPWSQLPERQELASTDPQAGQGGNRNSAVQGTVQQDQTCTEEEADAQAAEDLEQQKTFTEVDDDYFADALFIGDSRTVGLRDYGGMDNATFFASVGLTVYSMWEKTLPVKEPVIVQEDGETQGNSQAVMPEMTMEELLTSESFGKIYLQIGINEMGTGTVDTFMTKYGEAVQRLRELQPDAIIFVQAIMKVGKEKSESDPIFNNAGITERNERIAQLADGQQIFYIDMNEVVCDEEGNLSASESFDQIHLYGGNYNLWVDFLKTKGIL